MSRDRLEGADPAMGEDGLPTSPEPFWPSGWFGWVILISVSACVGFGIGFFLAT